MAMTAAELEIVVGANTKEAESGLGRVGGMIKGAAGGVMGLVGNVLKLGGIAAGGLGAGLVGGGIFSAWNQVSDVEQATVALRAYEKDAGKVDNVLGDLVDYARSDMGVLFNRTDLFGAAQSMKMYGAETDNLAGYTEILSRSVGLGLSDWDQLNTVIGRVGSTGRLTGSDFDYLRAAGFQLDDSLRNQNITWEELFMHLDQGIPADALAGQADTIRGRLIRLQSAVRNFGMAILGVDADTNKFIEGGLGDMMVKGITKTGELINSLVPVVTALMTSLVSGVQKIIGFVAPGFEFLTTVLSKFGNNIKTYGAWRGFMYALADAFDMFFGAGSGNKVIKYGLLIEEWMGKARVALVALWDGIKIVASGLWSFGAAVAGIIGDIITWAVNSEAVRNTLSALVGVVVSAATTIWEFSNSVVETISSFIGWVQGSDNAMLAIESLAFGIGLALVAIGAFKTAMLAWTVLTSIPAIITGIRTAVLAFNAALMANPAVLIVAAIIALGAAAYFAYQKFEPFRNLVNSVGSALKSFGKLVGGTVVSGLKKLGKALAPVGKAMGGAVAKGASKLQSGLQSVTGWVVDRLAVGLPILEGHFRRLAPIVGAQLVSSFNSLRSAVQTAWNFISSVFGSAAIAIFDNIKSAVMSIVQVFQTLGEAISLAFSGDWSGAFNKLKEAAGQAFDAIIELATLGIRSIITAFQEIDWGTLWEGLKTAASAAWEGLKDLASDAWDAISDFFTGIDWGGIWDGLQAGASAAWNALVSFFQGIDWGGLVSDLGSWLVDKGSSLINGLKNGIDTAWTTVTEWLADVGPKTLAAIPELVGTLLQKGKDLIQGIKDGAVSAWNSFTTWLSQLGGKAIDFIGNVLNTLKSKGKDLLDGMKAGAQEAWGTFTTWLSQIPSKVADFVGNALNTLKQKGRDIINGLKAGAQEGWNSFITWLESAINSAIDKLNTLIEGINSLYTWTGAPSIPLIPKIGEDAETSTDSVEGLGDALDAMTTFNGHVGLLKNITKDAIDAELRTKAARGELDALNNLMTSNYMHAGSGARDQGHIGSEYSNPYNPTEGGSSHIEMRPIDSGSSGMFGSIIAGAKNAQVALGNFNNSQVATGNQSVVSFGQVDTSAKTSLGPLAGFASNISNSMAGTWNRNMNSMAFASNGSMTDINVTSTSQTNSAKSRVISNVSAMASSFGSNMNSIASVTRSQMTAASVGAMAQMTAMQSGAATRLATMASTVSTRMGAIASTTNTQMSAANSSVSTQMNAMQLGTATKMAAMALTTNTNMVGMVNSTKTQTAAMSLAMSVGAAATALQLTSATAKWSSIVSNAGAGAASTARSVGYNIGAGVASGLYAALGMVTSAANAIIGQVDRAMRAKAQIKSPSRMTAYLGQMMGEGLAVGMEDTLGLVGRAGDHLTAAASIQPEATFNARVPVQAQPQSKNDAPTSTTTVHVTNHYTVTVDDLDDVKNATDFVKNLKKEYSLAV